MDEEAKPDREQVLSVVFDVVKEHDGITAQDLHAKVNEGDNDVSEPEIGIVLCMLEGQGLVEHFTQEVEAARPSGKTIRNPKVEFLYRALEPETEAPEPASWWARLWGLD